MPKISMKELEKFMKDNPDAPATQAIKEQLRENPAPEPNTGGCSGLTAGPADLWGDFVKFGGREVFLAEYANEFLTNYVTEQRSLRIAN